MWLVTGIWLFMKLLENFCLADDTKSWIKWKILIKIKRNLHHRQNPQIKTLKGPKWFQSDQNKVNRWFICSCLWMAAHGKHGFLCINTGISEWQDLSGEVRRGGDKIDFKAFRDNTEIRNHTCKHRFTVYTKNRSKMGCKDKLRGVTVQRQQGKKKRQNIMMFSLLEELIQETCK